jgi:hypothetical protein
VMFLSWKPLIFSTCFVVFRYRQITWHCTVLRCSHCGLSYYGCLSVVTVCRSIESFIYALVESFSISAHVLPPWGYCSIQVLKKDSTNLCIKDCANVYIKDSTPNTHHARPDQLPFPNYKGSCRIWPSLRLKHMPFLY